MNEFLFEESAWDLTLRMLPEGGKLSAVRFLTLMENEDEYTVEDALQELDENGIALDVSDLPKAAATGEAAVRLRREQQLVHDGTLLAALEENDPLRLYLEELAAIPACGDVRLLSSDAAQGSENARDLLANLMLSRVIEIAKAHVGCGVLLLDLIQEGGVGMWQSILNWNGDGDFGAHADWWIRQSMAKLITLQARSNGVGQKMRQALEDYRAVDERLLSELGRNATIEEIALELHMSAEEAATVKSMLDNARLISQAKSAAQPAEEAEEEERHVEDTALFQMRQRIMELLSGVSEDDAKLLTLRFGLEGGLLLSPEDTGKRMGLTPEEVVAREAAALAKLRNA